MRFLTHFAYFLLLLASLGTTRASCLWADLPGALKNLGTIGAPGAANTISGTTKLDTSGDWGAGIFFGTSCSEVWISRKGAGDWHLGTFRQIGGLTGGWSDQTAYCVGPPSYAPRQDINFIDWSPTPLVAANAICTRIWLCDPRGIYSGFNEPEWFKACAGGQDAVWMAKANPVVNVYGDFGDTPVTWSVHGWPQGCWGYNFVSLVDVLGTWPCDMMKDFFLPGALMSISDNGDGAVTLHWDGNWGCRSPNSRKFVR